MYLLLEPELIWWRKCQQLYRHSTEVPIREFADDLSIFIAVERDATGMGRFSFGGKSKEVHIVRRFPNPVHDRPFVIVVICASNGIR